MGDLIRQGKIRYFGVSNYRSWRVAAIAAICDRLGIDRPVVSSPYYNAMNRMPETEHLPVCAHFGLAVVPYSRWRAASSPANTRPTSRPRRVAAPRPRTSA